MLEVRTCLALSDGWETKALSGGEVPQSLLGCGEEGEDNHMTSELDELDQLTNYDVAVAEQARSDVFRSQNRCPLVEFEADVKVTGPHQKTGNARDGREWSQRVATFHLSRLVVYKAMSPIDVTELTFDVRLPDEGKKPRTNSEQGLMVKGAHEIDPGATSITWFNGRHLRFEETVLPMGTRKYERTDGTQGESPQAIFYYKPVSAGTANGHSAPTEPSEAALAAAIAFAVGKTAEQFGSVLRASATLSEEDQPRAVLIRGDASLVSLIVNGVFLSRMVDTGRLAKDAEGVYT